MLILRPGDVRYFTILVSDSSGSPVNADTTPAGVVKRNGVVDGSVAVTVTNRATGEYDAHYTIPAGYAAGDTVQDGATATVSGVAYPGYNPPLTLSAGAAGAGGVALAPGAADPAAAPASNSDPVLILQGIAGRLGVTRKTTYDKVAGTITVYRSDGTATWFVCPASSSATADTVGPGA